MLQLGEPPQVFMISATHPGEYDLPQLREKLGQQKTVKEVDAGKRLAVRQQGNSVLGWIERQNLPEQADRLADDIGRQVVKVGNLVHLCVNLFVRDVDAWKLSDLLLDDLTIDEVADKRFVVGWRAIAEHHAEPAFDLNIAECDDSMIDHGYHAIDDFRSRRERRQ